MDMSDTVDLLGPEPLYVQIAGVLRSRIADGTYQPRRALPTPDALAAEFDVSRNTVRAALALLAEEGLVQGVKGKGTYVRES